MQYRDQPLGAIAVSIPRATRLFRSYGLDFCCGGKQTLLRAAERKNLDIDQLEAQLQQLNTQTGSEVDWQTQPLVTMTGFLVSRFHQRHREQLPELVLLAQKVEQVHQDKPACPKGVAAQLHLIYEDLYDHMLKEEHVLFPLIEQGRGAQAAAPISVMELEHQQTGDLLEQVKALTNNTTPPEGACVTWRALYAGIDEFINDLMEHIHLENNILFPRALQGEQ